MYQWTNFPFLRMVTLWCTATQMCLKHTSTHNFCQELEKKLLDARKEISFFQEMLMEKENEGKVCLQKSAIIKLNYPIMHHDYCLILYDVNIKHTLQKVIVTFQGKSINYYTKMIWVHFVLDTTRYRTFSNDRHTALTSRSTWNCSI